MFCLPLSFADSSPQTIHLQLLSLATYTTNRFARKILRHELRSTSGHLSLQLACYNEAFNHGQSPCDALRTCETSSVFTALWSGNNDSQIGSFFACQSVEILDLHEHQRHSVVTSHSSYICTDFYSSLSTPPALRARFS